MKDQEQRPLVIQRQGQAGDQQTRADVVAQQHDLVSQPTPVLAGSSQLP